MEYCKYDRLGNQRISQSRHKYLEKTSFLYVSGPLQTQEDHDAPGSTLLIAAVI